MTTRLFSLAALLTLTACGDSAVRQGLVCTEFCSAKASCNDGFDAESCVKRCTDGLGNCQADEVAATLDELSTCADQECGTLGLCKLEADAQCKLGL